MAVTNPPAGESTVEPAEAPAPAMAPASRKEPRWRGRILPKSVLGICAFILAFSLGASLSGVVLYSYYEYRLGKNEDRITAFINGFAKSVKDAQNAITSQKAAASAEIAKELDPLRSVLAQGDTLQSLVARTSGALYFVHTLDENGQPSVGTAFAVASDSRQTLLLTSFNTVRAATKRPGPDVFVRKGTTDTKVTVSTWQEERDLALIILPVGSQPKLGFATANPAIGERVFAISGLGAQGASVTQGFVADVSSSGIQHDAPVGPAFQGGPLLNSDGQVLGVSSRTYAPLGFQSDGVWFAPPAKAACERVLICSGNTPATPGASP